MLLSTYCFLQLKMEKKGESWVTKSWWQERESNNRTVTHMSPDDDDEEESSVTFLNLISSLISISNKMLWIIGRLQGRRERMSSDSFLRSKSSSDRSHLSCQSRQKDYKRLFKKHTEIENDRENKSYKTVFSTENHFKWYVSFIFFKQLNNQNDSIVLCTTLNKMICYFHITII